MEANLPDSTTNKQNNNKLYLHFTFSIIIVTEGSFSLTVRYMQYNICETNNTLQVRKYLASK